MIPAVIQLTLRECFRRPLPYAIALAATLLALGSRSFVAFSFGAARSEAINLIVSAFFLAGFLHAALQGTALLRADLERGTLGLLLTKPLHLPAYLFGRYAGLALASLCLAGAVAALLAAIEALLPTDPSGPGLAAALPAPMLRAVLVVLVLDAAALTASAATSRVAAPLALLLLFLAGTLAGAFPFVPDFSLFGLDLAATPRWGTLALYAAANSSMFLLIALILLASKQPLRSPK